MNAVPQKLEYKISHTNQICKIHKEQMINVHGRIVCQSCVEKIMKQSNEKYESDKNNRILNLKMARAGIPKRVEKMIIEMNTCLVNIKIKLVE
ncbi:hypothetical protein PU705_003410 [Acinetobacter baumannii]